MPKLLAVQKQFGSLMTISGPLQISKRLTIKLRTTKKLTKTELSGNYVQGAGQGFKFVGQFVSIHS